MLKFLFWDLMVRVSRELWIDSAQLREDHKVLNIPDVECGGVQD